MKLFNLTLFYSCLSLFSCEIVPQVFTLDYAFGNFNSASAFSISSSGFIYVADDGDNSLIKLDTLGNVIKETGGYGWDESAFDLPTDVFATSLIVYISDKQNHRVKSFDKDLNYISALFTREYNNPQERFGYPLSIGLSNMGDLYVLDSENLRILKFDLFGNFIQNFGGFDWGNFSLKNPKKLAVSSDNSIFVIDDSLMIIYDQFGNGKEKINLQNSFSSIKISSGSLILNNENEVYMTKLAETENRLSKIFLLGSSEELKIVSATSFGFKLYVLTPNEICVFKRIER